MTRLGVIPTGVIHYEETKPRIIERPNVGERRPPPRRREGRNHPPDHRRRPRRIESPPQRPPRRLENRHRQVLAQDGLHRALKVMRKAATVVPTGEGAGATVAISVTGTCEVGVKAEARVGRVVAGTEAAARVLETSTEPPLDYGGVPSLIVVPVLESRNKKRHENQQHPKLMLPSIHRPFIRPLDQILLLQALQRPSTTMALVTLARSFLQLQLLLLLWRRSTMPETRLVGTVKGLEILPTLKRRYSSTLAAVVHDRVSDPVTFLADRPSWTRASPVLAAINNILMGGEPPDDRVHPPMTMMVVMRFYRSVLAKPELP